jgi:hypothetical protein
MIYSAEEMMGYLRVVVDLSACNWQTLIKKLRELGKQLCICHCLGWVMFTYTALYVYS